MPDPYRKKRMRAAAERMRRMGAVDFSLPVDGDILETRMPTVTAGDCMQSLIKELIKNDTPFFDEVVSCWKTLFPSLRARPGKWVEAGKGGKLFLYVSSAAALFALRPKLPVIKRRLSELSSAPAVFTVHLEIHMV